MPDSMIVVQTSTSYSCRTNLSITSSSLPSSIWPWPMPMRASGTSSRRSCGHVVDVVHAVMDEVDLPAAVEFAQDHLAHDALV